ncbi:MAG: reverse transcriptase family protein, partial [Candidatus Thiodiazotropha sp.]
EGNILPIYKNKGNINSAENYRPITLLSCFGKLFTAILNTRLNNYVNENGIIDSCQAGFRKGFSTTDNLFILQSLIQIAKTNKSKLYCAFIDFKQAFDTVWRNGLWQKLLNTKINGKCFNFIRNMYSDIKSRIITSEGESAFFPCKTGVRQGENLSPLLFSVYLNDLQHYLHSNMAPGVICESGEDDDIVVFLKLFILLFADDTVLFSSNMKDLQATLNIFESYCETWKLKVNTNKTKIMIFSGGRIPKNQKFYFKGQEIEIVNEYKYLGIFLARSGSFLKAKKHIVEQANNALFSLQRKIRFLNLPIDMQFDLFNKMIKPILLYGCELWGFGNIDSIERVQLKFLKQILNLKKSTPSFMVYGELGAYPLYIDIQCRMVSFWAKLGSSGNNDIATCLYQLIYSLNEQKRIQSKWLAHIKNIITSNGYGHVWNSHDEVNKKWFVQAFKQKLKDQYLQKWSSLVDQSSSGKNYRIFKEDFKMNSYFAFSPNRYCRILTAFRTRNHRLPVEVGRWTSIPINERLCPLCSTDIGDEYHYVMKCEFFKELRSQYIKPYYTRNINIIKFNELMNHKSKTVINKLCIFVDIIMKFFKDRQHIPDNLMSSQ